MKYKVIQLRTDGSKYVPKQHHTIVNWGRSTNPFGDIPNLRIINHPNSVLLATNKLRTFQAFKEREFPHVPEWTTERDVAASWIGEGGVAVCRTVLNGHSGRGIVVAETMDQLVAAPLYTRYVKKLKEFRCHVAFGNVVDVQEKRRRAGADEAADSKIRNHQTGWVYCRENIVEPEDLRQIAVTALAALGLDFGAVDIIYNQKQNRCYVLEINTACGLEGTTLKNYVNVIVENLK